MDVTGAVTGTIGVYILSYVTINRWNMRYAMESTCLKQVHRGNTKFSVDSFLKLPIAHIRLEHPGFRNSVAKFLEEEKQAISRGIEEFAPHSPYRETVFLPVKEERS